MTAITIPQFEEVTSKQFQSEFGRIVDIVKGKTPVAITQYGRPTMVLFPYDQAVEAKRLLAKQEFFRLLEERNQNPPKSLEGLTLEELDRMIDEERNAL
ncbi:TPA: type II toxin-antitoxin system prevent-host-death family antitoxin [Mannheimia haemolytica]|nr:type II toxin-antitoxin system prevent-host-death family antitoxin [Lonepinella koalarum]